MYVTPSLGRLQPAGCHFVPCHWVLRAAGMLQALSTHKARDIDRFDRRWPAHWNILGNLLPFVMSSHVHQICAGPPIGMLTGTMSSHVHQICTGPPIGMLTGTMSNHVHQICAGPPIGTLTGTLGALRRPRLTCYWLCCVLASPSRHCDDPIATCDASGTLWLD